MRTENCQTVAQAIINKVKMEFEFEEARVVGIYKSHQLFVGGGSHSRDRQSNGKNTEIIIAKWYFRNFSSE